jgi:hypothetical protein
VCGVADDPGGLAQFHGQDRGCVGGGSRRKSNRCMQHCKLASQSRQSRPNAEGELEGLPRRGGGERVESKCAWIRQRQKKKKGGEDARTSQPRWGLSDMLKAFPCCLAVCLRQRAPASVSACHASHALVRQDRQGKHWTRLGGKERGVLSRPSFLPQSNVLPLALSRVTRNIWSRWTGWSGSAWSIWRELARYVPAPLPLD